jgi:hypothetical protein
MQAAVLALGVKQGNMPGLIHLLISAGKLRLAQTFMHPDWFTILHYRAVHINIRTNHAANGMSVCVLGDCCKHLLHLKLISACHQA